MVIRRFLALVAVSFVAVLPAAGQDKPALEWKFEKGKTFYQDMTTKSTQKMKVMGQDVAQIGRAHV